MLIDNTTLNHTRKYSDQGIFSDNGVHTCGGDSEGKREERKVFIR